MKFKSIAFSTHSSAELDAHSDPISYFTDLNLDQIVDAVTAGREEYDLTPLYRLPLHSVADIEYRHGVFQDLERNSISEAIRSFAGGMRSVREQREQSGKLGHRYQKAWWLLRAVATYCDTARGLASDLSELDVASDGLRGAREFFVAYVASERFTFLARDAETLLRDLSAIRYSLLVKESSVTVQRHDGDRDYAAEVRETFAKFRQGAAKSYAARFTEWNEMNHVEAAIMDRVALLYPALFERLEAFSSNASAFIDQTIESFDREIQFYVAYLDLLASLRELGLGFCYPVISVEDKNIWSSAGFDLALAIKLAKNRVRVVPNDFHLEGNERIFIVSGPNQGGKTTFARAFGQLHYLASLGCPVPGSDAKLVLFDNIFTHFEREEDITNLHGKLHDDLVRMRAIVDRATSESVVILNEIFNSTTLNDEVFLSERVLEKVLEIGCVGVCVTFIDELSRLSERTVSMMSTVVRENPAERTFKVVRKAADSLAYAMAIAEKHRVTYPTLAERLSS